MTGERISVRAARICSALLAFSALAAYGIELPKPAEAAPPAAAAPANVDIAPSDETAFYERLQYVTHKRNLVGLGMDDATLRSLAAGSPDMTIASLSSRSAGGDVNATIALVRIQHWCNRISSARPANAQAQVQRLASVLPAERLPKMAGVFAAERTYQEKARAGCSKAPFDYQGIESRLRGAAEAGDPASATELAQFVRDPAKREALLEQAAAKNYPPAMYALATARLAAVQRNRSTENVSSIRLLLKQAGRTLPRAKVDLANCMATGCDGHPADGPGAAPFGLDAARDGEPLAFTSMLRMPWSGRLNRAQMLGWQYFGNRLNEEGCTGDGYVQNAVVFAQSISMLEKGVPPSVLQEAASQAETLWQQSSERAKKEQGCG